MARYAINEVTFKSPIACLGSSAWMAEIKQGGFASCEYDTADCMIVLVPGSVKPGLKKRRVHISNTLDVVYGPMLANNKD